MEIIKEQPVDVAEAAALLDKFLAPAQSGRQLPPTTQQQIITLHAALKTKASARR